jgi:hypothetical protein
MFVEEPREVDGTRLRFVRWLIDHGRLEHAPVGPPHGEYAWTDLTASELFAAAVATRPERMEERAESG